MKISIVIPVYNVSNYIERCLRSVINQIYNGEIECIIVDDASPDNSINICESIIKQYNGNIHFHIIHHKTNMGLSSARNTGTKNATGQFIFYLDSDDEISTNCIQLLANEIEKHPEVELVQGGTEAIPYREYYNVDYLKNIDYINNNKLIQKLFFNYGHSLPVNAWNKLIKLDFIRKNNIFFKDGIIHEDQLWMFYLVKHVQNMSFCHNKTYFHYITSGSIMTSTPEEKSAQNWAIILDDVSRHFGTSSHLLQYSYYYKFFSFFFVRYHYLPVFKKLYKRYLFISLKKMYVKMFLLLVLLKLSIFLNKGQNRIKKKINAL